MSHEQRMALLFERLEQTLVEEGMAAAGDDAGDLAHKVYRRDLQLIMTSYLRKLYDRGETASVAIVDTGMTAIMVALSMMTTEKQDEAELLEMIAKVIIPRLRAKRQGRGE